jgi:hypothetical protein
MNKTVKTLKEHIVKSGMMSDMVKYINDAIPTTIFPNARLEKISINTLLECLEDAKGQHTVLSTARLSYDGVKFYLAFKANDFFKNYDKANIKVLSLNNLDENSEIITKSFDVLFSINGEIVALEIKVTQSAKSFTGATHSTKKVNDYLLISLSIDRDSIIEENKKYVKGVFAMMVSLKKEEWNGKASDNSSWTKLDFKVGRDYSDNLICGGFKKKKTNMEIVFENL